MLMRISKLQRKMLITMLRHKRNEIHNFHKLRWKQFCKDEPSKGLNTHEIEYVSAGYWGDNWRYERSMEPLIKAKLVKTTTGCRHKYCYYLLSPSGIELAEKIEAEEKKAIKEYERWVRIFNFSDPVTEA